MSNNDMFFLKKIFVAILFFTIYSNSLANAEIGPNIISNFSVENASSDPAIPIDWLNKKEGTNDALFKYPINGQDGNRALQAEIKSYSNGDAKWYFKPVTVTPRSSYIFSDYYQSNVQTTVTIEYTSVNGIISTINLGTLPPSRGWTKFSKTFTVPANASKMTVFHRINKIGFLKTDNFSLSLASFGQNDTTPPLVAISSPLKNSVLSGAIQLSAIANDNKAVSSVNFFIDDVSFGSGLLGSGSNSYSLLIDTSAISNGLHVIRAEATDTSNNSSASANVNVNVDNSPPDIIPPIVSIASPLSGSILTGATTLNIETTDIGGIAFVHYSVSNGTDDIVGQLTKAPYIIQISPGALKNGSHVITVYAQDLAGNIGNASPITYFTDYTPDTNQNFILNPSFETGSGGLPDHWFHGIWGNNSGSFVYPVTGIDGGSAAEVTLNSYVDGDAKWYFEDVEVLSGATYVYSDKYKSTTGSIITARYTYNDGSGTMAYVDLVSLPASENWTTSTQIFTIPANVNKVTVFHLINSMGTLSIDDTSLKLYSTGSINDPNVFNNGMVSLTFDDGWSSHYDNALPILENANIKGGFYIITNEMKNSVNENRILNPSLEIQTSGNLPTNWNKSQTGDNDAVFSYPVQGVSGGNAIKVEITSYTNGEAAWKSSNNTVASNEPYNFSDQYISDVPTKVTLVYTMNNDSTQTIDLGVVPASATWSLASFTFTPPTNVESLTVYHSLISSGSLITDDYHLDLAQDYMNTAQVKEIYNAGHEIGPHSRTHPFLTTISNEEVINEISGSRQDLLDLGIIPSDTFVYPYGEYNSSVVQIAKDAGYIGARSVNEGYNTKVSDKYGLQIQQVNSLTTPQQWELWTQSAMENKKWLILMFHQIDYQNDEYGAKTEDLKSYVDYLVTNNIPVVTLKQGIELMSQ